MEFGQALNAVRADSLVPSFVFETIPLTMYVL